MTTDNLIRRTRVALRQRGLGFLTVVRDVFDDDYNTEIGVDDEMKIIDPETRNRVRIIASDGEYEIKIPHRGSRTVRGFQAMIDEIPVVLSISPTRTVSPRPHRPLPSMESTMFINLTPHAINVNNGPTVPPSGQVARCATTSEAVGAIEGVTLYRTTYGDVVGLPEPQPGRYYIVSALVRQAVPTRKDVLSPGEPVRDSDGTVTGCKGLIANG